MRLALTSHPAASAVLFTPLHKVSAGLTFCCGGRSVNNQSRIHTQALWRLDEPTALALRPVTSTNTDVSAACSSGTNSTAAIWISIVSLMTTRHYTSLYQWLTGLTIREWMDTWRERMVSLPIRSSESVCFVGQILESETHSKRYKG